ncbi:MAG: alpha-L-rhamnosidase C-terminal domain-containing protein [Acidobacteriota bacterium]
MTPSILRTNSASFRIITRSLLVASLATTAAFPQVGTTPLDPTRGLTGPLESSLHQPLPEQYIWTAPDHAAAITDKIQYTFPKVTEATEPHFFRKIFALDQVPAQATLYLAGPRSASIYINGKLVRGVDSDVTHPLAIHVFATPIASFLKPGKNTLALEVVRGRGVTGFTNSALVMQQTFGEVLVAKILPAAPYLNATPLMMSDESWRSTTTPSTNWQSPTFDDASWKPVQDLGPIEHTLDLFQWNADAGLYDWPGYDGISPFLAHTRVPVAQILSSAHRDGRFDNLASLTSSAPAADFTVHLSAPTLIAEQAPEVILDFGKELTGRLELVSNTDSPVAVTMQYGESYDEMLKSPYLGVNLLTIAPHQTAHGPKSSFRYARIVFVGGPAEVHFKSIAADDIFYPVKYQGSFESSDPMLNRIWETAAYTAHLCMQDDVWDSPKRDRGRWMGDTDVMGRTIEDAFDDRFLMEDTLDRLLGPAPVQQDVNGIPGYSAAWFTGIAQYYRQTGSIDFLRKEHARMLQLLTYVDSQFGPDNLYANKANVWLYVDWSPELNGDTPETRRATTLEFYRAYRDAAWMLRELGDTANATHYDQRADSIKAAAQKSLIDPATGSFGPRWQTNAAAVLSGVADPSQYNAIWSNVLSHVGHIRYNGLVTTPYYNYYIISAMAQTNHREDALQWIRQYWGGMLDEGATSFWEAYDPDWFKEDFHASLQADNRSGYFVSLAHGWASGAGPWLTEQVLGIQSTAAGMSKLNIRPDLLDLKWARGAVPTPNGLLKLDIKRDPVFTVELDLPPHTTATVSLPVSHTSQQIMVNGDEHDTIPTENGTRAVVVLDSPGRYTLSSR